MEWLGEVPSHWTVTGLKRAFSIAGGSTPKSDIEDYWGGDIPWITPGDLSKLSTKFISDTARKITASGLASCAASLRPAGSIVISTRAPIGSLAVTEIGASTNQGCKTLVVKDRVSATFGYYALSIATEQLNVRGKGSTFLEISADDLGAFALPFPPQSEQIAIAAFLDRETAKIDALIEEQRRLIALLKEKRQAVISHAVTKGLDPNAPMKDSGIEWLGEVPAHWDIVKVARYFRARKGKEGQLLTKEYCADNAGGYPVYSGQTENGGVMGTLDRYEFDTGPNGVLFSTTVGAKAMTVSHIAGKFSLSQNCMIIEPDASNAATRFYFYHFQPLFRYHRNMIPEHMQASFRMDDLYSFAIALPPLNEQKAIAAYIDQRLASFDETEVIAATSISLLQERRAALISAAITGKIDVRGSAKVLPFPINRAQARGLIAAEIIERSAHQSTFGRVKFQKIAFLAEAHVGISELAGSYTREAAGPLDRALIEEMESGARSIAGIEHEQPGGAGTTVSYRLGQQRGAHRQELAQWLGEDRTAKLDKLIGDFAALGTKEAEAVATLYGVWNDALSEGALPSDDEIISGFLNDWHPEKRAKFRASDLPEWLGWMRRHGIVPTGSGPKTTTGRLFV